MERLFESGTEQLSIQGTLSMYFVALTSENETPRLRNMIIACLLFFGFAVSLPFVNSSFRLNCEWFYHPKIQYELFVLISLLKRKKNFNNPPLCFSEHYLIQI